MYPFIRKYLPMILVVGLFLGMADMPVSAATWPDAPENLSATAINYMTVYLDWDPVNDADDYTYEYATSFTGPWTSPGLFLSVTSISVSGLTTGTTYYFRVYAWKTDKNGYHHRGTVSSVVSARPMTPAPKYLSVSSTNYDTLRLTWGLIAFQTGFQIWRKYGISSWTLVADMITVTSYNDIGLACGTEYSYQLRAYYSVGSTKYYSDYSNIVKGVPALLVPDRTLAYSIGYDTLHVDWHPVDGATGYEIERAPAPAGSWTQVGKTSATHISDTGLSCGLNYYYRVRAYRTLSKTNTPRSDWSPVFSGKPVPAIPFNLAVSSASYNSLQLTWSAVGGASGYDVRRSTSAGGPWTTLTTSATQANYLSTGLTTGTIYFYQVRAYKWSVSREKVYGEWSSAASGNPVPAKPTGLAVASVNGHTLRLTWSPVNGASGYYVERAQNPGGPWSLADSSVTTTYLWDYDLVTNMTYYYRLKAYRLVSMVLIFGEISNTTSGKPMESASPTIAPGSSPSPSPAISPPGSTDGTTSPTGSEALSPTPVTTSSSETSSGQTTGSLGPSPGSSSTGAAGNTNAPDTTSGNATSGAEPKPVDSSTNSDEPQSSENNGGEPFPWIPLVVIAGVIGVGAGAGVLIQLRKKH